MEISKQIAKKEEQLRQVALEFANLHLSDKNMVQKSHVWLRRKYNIELKYYRLLEQWSDMMYKSVVGKNKTYIINKMHKRRIKKIEYLIWYRDVVDSSGEVISIEKTKIIKINDILVDDEEKPVKFNPTNKKS